MFYTIAISATLVGEHYPAPFIGGFSFTVQMPIKVAVLIDGGFLRKNAKMAKKLYNPDFIESFGHACKSQDEEIFRILYYDCAPYKGTVKLPISGLDHTFQSNDAWLHALAHKDLFAVRRGELKFRGWLPKKKPQATAGTTAPVAKQLGDADFKPDFEQKGVDMRIGLDVAAYSANRSIERIILVSGDTDCSPALKYGRKAGLQTVLIEPNGNKVTRDLLAHADFTRAIAFP